MQHNKQYSRSKSPKYNEYEHYNIVKSAAMCEWVTNKNSCNISHISEAYNKSIYKSLYCINVHNMSTACREHMHQMNSVRTTCWEKATSSSHDAIKQRLSQNSQSINQSIYWANCV